MTKTISLKAGIIGILAYTTLAFQAFAFPANMETAGPTNPPVGHYEFCRANPDECRAAPERAIPIALTRDIWQTILEVNYDINEQITPMTDKEIYGVEEHWAYPDTVGDCEDYVLLKRRALMQAGIAPGNLLITVVLQPNGDGHAVLTVRTDRGDFILDNMRSKVLIWSDTEYTYLKRQAVDHAGRWVKLQDGRAVAVGSVRTQ
jgi:predicted transglutaminase-like cysteine proteinase